jgi:hypothetical protein
MCFQVSFNLQLSCRASSKEKIVGKCRVWCILRLKSVCWYVCKTSLFFVLSTCTLSSGLILKQANNRFELDPCWYEDLRTSLALGVVPCLVESTKVGSPVPARSQKEKDTVSRTICIQTSKWIVLRPWSSKVGLCPSKGHSCQWRCMPVKIFHEVEAEKEVIFNMDIYFVLN